MINLLPVQARRRASLEYRLRFAAVALFAAAGLSLMLGGLLMPAYFFAMVARTQSSIDEKSVDASLSGTQAADLAAQERTTALLLTAITKESAYPRPSQAIDAALTAPHKGIALERIEYTVTAKGGTVLRLSGVALTRDELLAFKQALSDARGISNVNIPLSSLALSSNLPFSISLSYAPSAATSTLGKVVSSLATSTQTASTSKQKP